MKGLALWIAQGLGIGRIPFAPGTFGSLLGVAWFFGLLASGNLWTLVAGTVAGVVLSIWLCGVAEKALGQKDPGSVVLDEISAVPLCFLGWVGLRFWQAGFMPLPGYFLSSQNWVGTACVFAAFRFFDIAKPWPVRQSQRLPGGWGITIDDALAAVYVNAVVLVVWGFKSVLAGGR